MVQSELNIFSPKFHNHQSIESKEKKPREKKPREKAEGKKSREKIDLF